MLDFIAHWGMYAPSALTTCILIAYFVNRKRMRTFKSSTGLNLLLVYSILFGMLTYINTPTDYRSSLHLLTMMLSVVPPSLFVILLLTRPSHRPFVNALLDREPTDQPLPAQWRISGIVVATLVASLSGAAYSLQTCEWLDRITERTGCVQVLEYDNGISDIAFSPDGTLLALGGFEHTAQIWRVADGTLLHTLEGHSDFVSSISFSPDGTLLATGAIDNTVNIWRVADGSLIRSLNIIAAEDYVYELHFSSDGDFLGAGIGGGVNNNELWLWNTTDWSQAAVWQTDGSSFAFSPDAPLIATTTSTGTVALRRVPDGAVIKLLSNAAYVQDLVVAPGNTYVAGILDRQVWIWGLNTNQVTLLAESGWTAAALAFIPSGTHVIVGHYRNEGAFHSAIQILDTSSWKIQAEWEAHKGLIQSVTISSDQRYIASTSGFGSVRIWRVPAVMQ